MRHRRQTAMWIVIVTQATSSQAFAQTISEGARRYRNGGRVWCETAPREPAPGLPNRDDGVALVGAERRGQRLSTGAIRRTRRPS